MTVRVADPDGQEWTVRRSLVRGRGGRGWRWRWRGPDWLGDLASLLEIGQLADVPIIGPVVIAIVIPILVVVVVVLLPALAIGLVEALVLGALFAAGLVAATLFGRPILVRAEQRTDARGEEAMHVWAARGWGSSRQLRDDVVTAIRRGDDPATVHRQDAVPLGHPHGPV